MGWQGDGLSYPGPSHFYKPILILVLMKNLNRLDYGRKGMRIPHI